MPNTSGHTLEKNPIVLLNEIHLTFLNIGKYTVFFVSLYLSKNPISLSLLYDFTLLNLSQTPPT